VSGSQGLALLVAGLISVGCQSTGGAGEPATQPAGAAAAPPAAAQPHMHDALQGLPATAGPDYAVADVRFMQGMIGHHAQAVTMAEWAPTHDAGEPLRILAEKIWISQRDEIEFMKRWLAERGQAVPDDARIRSMRMPGMLTEEQMARLEAASGREFDRLFLIFMVEHHRGALQMVATLFDDPTAAQESEIFRFVTDVDTDQRNEIYVMETMLDTMNTNRGSQSR
jgi:uncharacterized protein (DUF305 family)